MVDEYNGMWVNPMSATPRASIMRDYVRDMSRKEREADFFARNSGAATWGSGGPGGPGGSGDVDAAEHARQAKLAADQQVSAANKMFDLQKNQRARARKDIKTATGAATGKLSPWREAGVDALGKLQTKIADGPGDFEQSPGYQFRLDEGQKALERGASARGGVLSGAAVKDAMRYGQNFATNDYDNFLRRYYESMAPLERMSGKGYEASTKQGEFEMQGARDMTNSGQMATNQMGDATKYGGESLAGGTMNAANIMAVQQQAAAERDYGYNAWKKGENF